jgi:hypothetical protein
MCIHLDSQTSVCGTSCCQCFCQAALFGLRETNWDCVGCGQTSICHSCSFISLQLPAFSYPSFPGLGASILPILPCLPLFQGILCSLLRNHLQTPQGIRVWVQTKKGSGSSVHALSEHMPFVQEAVSHLRVSSFQYNCKAESSWLPVAHVRSQSSNLHFSLCFNFCTLASSTYLTHSFPTSCSIHWLSGDGACLVVPFFCGTYFLFVFHT